MTAPRPTFRPIPAPLDVDDGALAQLNDKLGVPALVTPASATPTPEAPAVSQKPAEDSPKRSPRPSPTRIGEDPPTVKKSAIPALAPVEKLSVELPGYLTDALKRHAAEHRTSVRHIVMRGLEALGFEIAAPDMVPDARRVRAKKPRKR